MARERLSRRPRILIKLFLILFSAVLILLILLEHIFHASRNEPPKLHNAKHVQVLQDIIGTSMVKLNDPCSLDRSNRTGSIRLPYHLLAVLPGRTAPSINSTTIRSVPKKNSTEDELPLKYFPAIVSHGNAISINVNSNHINSIGDTAKTPFLFARRWPRTPVNVKRTIDPASWVQKVERGRQHLCAFSMPIDKVDQSPWTNLKDLTNWGWTYTDHSKFYTGMDAAGFNTITNLQQFCEDNGIPAQPDGRGWKLIEEEQDPANGGPTYTPPGSITPLQVCCD
jgi:hypothetical protein